jgi:hypothetical protein
MEWRADHVTFTAWNGWSNTPAPSDIIYQWTYTGGNIPPVGQQRVHINLWLLNGNAPVSGNGDEMVITFASSRDTGPRPQKTRKPSECSHAAVSRLL